MPQRVLITGGLGTLGAAVAHAFEAAGASVALIDVAPEPPGAGPTRIGGVDLTDLAEAGRAFGAAKAALGGADVVVNVAGGFTFEKVSGDAAAWRRMFDMNLTTCLNMCRVAAAGLSDGGAIVNVGAAASEHAAAGMGPYAASKAAVARLTEALAAELGGRIRVNAVLPLTMDTPANRRDMPDVDPKSWTTPAAVADAIVFLASPQSRAINGALVPVANPGVWRLASADDRAVARAATRRVAALARQSEGQFDAAIALFRQVVELTPRDPGAPPLYEALDQHGARPVRALQRLRAVLFTAERARLLSLPDGSPGLLIERRGFLRDGRVVEFTQSYYRGDAYNFVAELNTSAS